jgi:hypothetical protein
VKRAKGRRAKARDQESGAKPEGFLRPKAVVLPTTALVPQANLIKPAPNQFTHELTRSQPYYFDRSDPKAPDGEFRPGTKVVLLVDDGSEYCRVCDAQGLYVTVPRDSLKRL